MKIKRVWSFLLVLMMVLSTFLSASNVTFAAAAEGAGTAESPYLIRTVEDLYRIPNNPKAHYKLMNDLDLGNKEREPMAEFYGSFDGNGYELKNLLVSGFDNIGLFSKTASAVIKNITVVNAKVTATGTNSSVLVGYAVKTTFENCAIKNYTIFGKYNAGGLSSFTQECSFSNCSTSNGKITISEGYAGGLAALCFKNSQLYRCFSFVDIDAKGYSSGGLIGIGYRGFITLKECYSISKVNGYNDVGGLVGSFENSGANSEITDCFAISEVSSTKDPNNNKEIGGLVSNYAGIKIKNSYSASILIDAFKIGLGPGEINNSYFNQELAGLTLPVEQARTTTQMYQKSNYKGWDFENVWQIDEGKDYPRLRFMSSSPELIPLEKIELQPDTAEVLVGENITIVPIYTPENATNKNLTWFSTNPSAFTVDERGIIRAIATGYGSIIAISEDGHHVAYCNVLVK